MGPLPASRMDGNTSGPGGAGNDHHRPPVDVLSAARGALSPDGALLVADEAVARSFTAPGDAVERMTYGWSITHCLSAAMAEPDSAAIGTVIREATVRRLAAGAGFGRPEVLEVDGGFFRLYALRP